jgi:hypothetical protein
MERNMLDIAKALAPSFSISIKKYNQAPHPKKFWNIIQIESLKILLNNDFGINVKNHIDAGSIIYKEEQEKYNGGSGPVCLPLVLFNNILKQKKYKKILVIATGSLHSPVLVNQKHSIPSIAHLISLEVI